MKEVSASVQDELEHLRKLTSSDVAALAFMEKHESHIKWRYAVGNLNDRYNQIYQRPGRGLAGLVYRIGRMVLLDATHPNRYVERKDFPIMLAENLYAALTVPVSFQGNIYGVLLIGSRDSNHIFEKEDINLMTTISHHFVPMFLSGKIE